MRPAAEVDEFPLTVERNRRGIVEAVDQLHFVAFPAFLEKFDGVLLGQLAAGNRQTTFHDLDSARLDLFQIFRRERTVESEVVIEPIVQCRADRQLGRREHFLHGLRHDVGAAVAIDLAPFGRLEGQRLDGGVLL